MMDDSIEMVPELVLELQQKRIGFIGAGNIALALAKFMINSKNIEGKHMHVSAKTTRNFKPWQALGITCTTNNREVVMNCGVIILAVHPRSFKEAISQAGPEKGSEKDTLGKKIFISVIEGITLQSLSQNLKSVTSDMGVIRVVTNIPVEFATGCVAYTIGENVTEDEGEMIRLLLIPAGFCKIVTEDEIDCCSALIGSGTCFVLMVIQALADGGVKMGISHQTAIELAAKMMIPPAGRVYLAATMSHNKLDLTGEFLRNSGEITLAVRDGLKMCFVKPKVINAVDIAFKRIHEISKQNC